MQQAAQYLDRGWSVIPLKAGTKVPVDKWKEYAQRRPTQLELQTMFAGRDVNVGIITGPVSELVVVDIDRPELYEEYLKKYPTHLISQTPRGGFHLYYQYKGDDIGNSASKLQSGIDVRGRHGYVVAAPSAIKLGDSFGEYRWIEYDKPSPLPAELHDRIISELAVQQPAKKADNDWQNLWAKLLRDGFTPHRHNEEVKDAARYLYRMGVGLDIIIDTLTVLNAKDATPLAQSELEATIKSGVKYEQKRLEGQDKKQQAAQAFAVESYIDTDMSLDDTGNQWLIDDWLPLNSVVVMSAPPENYKTWLALEMGIVVAMGDSTKFLNGFAGPKEAQGVLLVQQEDDYKRTRDRIRAIVTSKARGKAYGFYSQKLDEDNLFISFGNVWNDLKLFVHRDSRLTLDDNGESVALLREEIKKHNIKFVIVDPVYSLGSPDDYFASLARKMQQFKRIRDELGVTFLFVHHNKKGTKNQKIADVGERENMHGSQLFSGSFEGQIMINMAEGQRIITRSGKAFDGAKEKYALEFDINTDVPEYVDEDGVLIPSLRNYYEVKVSTPKQEGDEVDNQILEVLTLQGGLRVSHIHRSCKELFDSAPALNTIKARLQKLEATGRVKFDEKTRTYGLTDEF